MNGMFSKDKLVFDSTAISDSDNVGAWIVASDGTLIDKANINSVNRLAVDSTLKDGAGTALTSTLVSGKQALDVNLAGPISVAVDLNGIYDVSTNPNPDNAGAILFQRAAAPALSDQTFTPTGGAASSDAVVAANVHAADVNGFLMGYNGATWDRLHSTSGALNVQVQNSTLAVTQSGTWTVGLSEDHNYGAVGSNTLRTAAQIGNATGAADFGAGTTSAQTLRVVLPTDQTSIPVAQSGTWTVQQGTPPWDIEGNVADGAADSGKPVKMGSKIAAGPLSAGTAGNRADAISDLYRRIYVNSGSNIGLKNSQQNVDNSSAVQLAATPLAGRRLIMIENLSNQPIYIGKDNTVTSGNGFRCAAGSTFSLEAGDAVALWAIGASGSAQDLRVLELA